MDQKVKRRSSRFGLAGFFNRSKPTAVADQLAEGIKEEDDVGSAERSIMKATDSSHPSVYASLPEELDVLPSTEPSVAPLRHKPSKAAITVKSSSKGAFTLTRSTTWDPPPLFQAYPQAIKQATLHVPCLSAEAILRLHANQNTSANPSSNPSITESNSSKSQKDKRLKRHTAADVLSKGEWTNRIYILVTSGYIIQYAGEGNFDRLPEKIMPLTPESAAFASDAIPGQPYVLQISQVSDDQGTLDKDASRSMLKRLGLRNELRRSTSAFLLILASADEMSAWLSAVRREIQAMGGKEYKPDEFPMRETGKPIPPLQHKPSQRYLVTRDPNQSSMNGPDPATAINVAKDQSLEPSVTKRQPLTTQSSMASGSLEPSVSKRQSLATQSSMVTRSASNTTSSINQAYTEPTSQESSPRPSPDRTKSGIPDLTRAFAESRRMPSTNSRTGYDSKLNHLKVNASYQELVRPGQAALPPQHSGRSTPENMRTPSPAPNLSVPSFSKRYSTALGSSLASTASKPQSPPVSRYKPPTPPNIEKEASVAEKPHAVVSELQHLRKSSLNTLRKNSGIENEASLTPPHSSGSCGPRPSSDGNKRFSRRLSSLEYSRGVSPIQLAHQSPSPHPPPTAALPPLPAAASAHRTSLFPPPTGTKQGRLREGLIPPLDGSPPRPTRKAPSAPPQQAYGQQCRSIARVGREPPPVSAPTTSLKPRISVSSQAESYFDSPAPHPFIPPIQVSERKFRGSLDGPWNVPYNGPQRNFLDLIVG